MDLADWHQSMTYEVSLFNQLGLRAGFSNISQNHNLLSVSL